MSQIRNAGKGNIVEEAYAFLPSSSMAQPHLPPLLATQRPEWQPSISLFLCTPCRRYRGLPSPRGGRGCSQIRRQQKTPLASYMITWLHLIGSRSFLFLRDKRIEDLQILEKKSKISAKNKKILRRKRKNFEKCCSCQLFKKKVHSFTSQFEAQSYAYALSRIWIHNPHLGIRRSRCA